MTVDGRFRRRHYFLRQPFFRSDVIIHDAENGPVLRYRKHVLYDHGMSIRFLEFDGPGTVHYLSSYTIHDRRNDETLGLLENRDRSAFTNDRWQLYDAEGHAIGVIALESEHWLRRLIPMSRKRYRIVETDGTQCATLQKALRPHVWTLTMHEHETDEERRRHWSKVRQPANVTVGALDRRLLIGASALITGIGGGLIVGPGPGPMYVV